MRFMLSSGALLKAMQPLSGFISTNNVIPITRSVLFQLNKNKLTLTSTDLQSTMTMQVDIQSEDIGEVCIEAKMLMDYLRVLPEQPISFDVNMIDYSVDMTSELGKSKLVGEDASAFPKTTDIEADNTLKIVASELAEGIQKTLVATAVDDIRPTMAGVNFELSKHNLTLVSTDAHRLVRYIKKDVSANEEKAFVVPKKPLMLLEKIIASSSEELELSSDNHSFCVKGEDFELKTRLIDGKFPDYKVVIPKDNPFKLIISRDDFYNALRRVDVFANKTTHQVILEITGNKLHLYASDEELSHESHENMPCQYEGEDMQIAFNAKLLLDLVSVIDADELVFELSAPSRAGIIKPKEPKENEDLLVLMMPLMIH